MSHDGSSDFFRHQYNNQKFQRKDFHLPDRYSWEKRQTSPNTTPASTVLNSPDLIEVHYQHQHQIKVGRSPVSQQDSLESTSPMPSSENIAISSTIGNSLDYDVIYDDIADNWKSEMESQSSSSASNKLTKMIGVLPIAEYEGSPRRFGDYNQEQQSSLKQDRSMPKGMMPSMKSNTGFSKAELYQRLASTSQEPTSLHVKSTDSGHDDECSSAIVDEPKPNKPLKDAIAFDYLYEFSETRKVLEDFFRNSQDEGLSDRTPTERKETEFDTNCSYIGQRLANVSLDDYPFHYNNIMNQNSRYNASNEIELYLDSNSHSSGELADTELDHHTKQPPSRHFTLSPESTDFDSNCGDLDSSLNEPVSGPDFGRLYTGMPILEDGLSSGHASDTDNNNSNFGLQTTTTTAVAQKNLKIGDDFINLGSTKSDRSDYHKMSSEIDMKDVRKPVYEKSSMDRMEPLQDIEATIRDIRTTLQHTKALVGTDQNLGMCDYIDSNRPSSPVWIPRRLNESRESVNSDDVSKPLTPDEEEADTDLETDRLLGQQRLDDQSYNEDKNSWRDHSQIKKSLAAASNVPQTFNTAAVRQGIGTPISPNQQQLPAALSEICPASPPPIEEAASKVTTPIKQATSKENLSLSLVKPHNESERSEKGRNKEGFFEPAVLIEGVLFRARYLGSTQLVCEGQPTKSTRMLQAEEAVSRIKAPEGESQPSTEVDLFISTEKIMVLNTDLKEIMMDHSLRTISYIADIGDLVVLMARRRFVSSQQSQSAQSSQDNSSGSAAPPDEAPPKPNRTPKMICHVFESEEAQFIAQSIGQAFQVAYMEFLKANGIEDHSFVKEMDYQEVLNSQEIFGDELEIFAKKELQKEVVVPKAKGEILGLVVVESGWGSMLPTVVIANLLSTAAAARCGQLNIGDQIIAINGLSLVGLPLSTCQNYIRNTKNQSAVKFTVVPCPPVVEVKIKRPNTKYQLGFSVQNGVICSLLRGGIAERGGVRVGHRIIEINNQSVVAVPHEKIVSLLATSVGEILMKTMPTSMFRLLTGQENPIYI